jgi:HlyD family secretion protein
MAAGQVSVLAVREGDKVSAGQVLLEIWNADLKAEIAHAEAEAAAARARVGEACTSAAGAEREAARLKRLVDRKMVSEDNADVADTAARAKRSACQAAVATTVVSDARIEAVRAALDRTRVRAPFAGTIAEVNAELGGYVTPSPQGILTLPAIDLLDVSCLYVSAPIDEVDAPAIQVGMRACVSLDAFSDKRCNGVVRRVAPYVLDAEKQARTVEVEVELRDPKDLADLLPGYSADIEVTLDVRESALRVPSEAVIDGRYVFVHDPGAGTIAKREFMPGLANWRYTEVVSGLDPGTAVVSSVGREGVEDGARVTTVDESSADGR